MKVKKPYRALLTDRLTDICVKTHQTLTGVIEEALAALDAFLASPSVRLLLPGEQFAAMLLRCLREGDARGNIAFDAQIATLCREQGIDRILTEDRDFARFPPLRTVLLFSPLES